MKDWKSSFDVLAAMFPQVDSRLLKAAALEHGDDVYPAYEFILKEVLPRQNHHDEMTQPQIEVRGECSGSHCPSGKSYLFDAASKEKDACIDNEGITAEQDLRGFSQDTNFFSNTMPIGLSEPDQLQKVDYKPNELKEPVQLQIEDHKPIEFCELVQIQNVEHGHSELREPFQLQNLDYEPTGYTEAVLLQDFDYDRNLVSNMHDTESCIGQIQLNANHDDDCDVQSCYVENVSELSTTNKDSSLKCSTVASIDDSYHRQNVSTDILEELIVSARKEKDKLTEGMHSISLLKETAESEESLAQHAREEAEQAGLEIMAKVEELRTKTSRTKETNAMHASEVYGERSVLGTEARELHSRLSTLSSDETRASFMIDEIQSKLKERIECARKDREAAELEKAMQEENASKILAMEECQMAIVNEESQQLEVEAEANAKLKEFLIDRSLVVDALQGEVSVLCEDLELLKVQIDEGIAKLKHGIEDMRCEVEDIKEKTRLKNLSVLSTESMLRKAGCHEPIIRDQALRNQIESFSQDSLYENIERFSPVASCQSSGPGSVIIDKSGPVASHHSSGCGSVHSLSSLGDDRKACIVHSSSSLSDVKSDHSFGSVHSLSSFRDDKDGYTTIETDNQGRLKIDLNDGGWQILTVE